MSYEAYENIPHGWEVMDSSAIPPRTFVVGLTEQQAKAVANELNGSDECPFIVIYGTISDGFSFYGPFASKAEVDRFIDRLGFNVDACEVRLIDIPTH
jgi:hypothetical protein